MGVRQDLDRKAERYIYHLIDESEKVLYVGTAVNPKQRFKAHIKKISENNPALIYQYCFKHKIKLRCRVIKKILCNYNEAEKYEIEEINKHNKTCLNFYNNQNKERYYQIEKELKR